MSAAEDVAADALVGCTWMRSSRSNNPKDNVRAGMTRAQLATGLIRDPVVLDVPEGASRKRIQDAKRDQLHAYALATFEGDVRGIAQVETVYAAGLDLDDPALAVSLETACGMLPWAGVVLTTSAHTDAAPRLRAHVWLSRPVTADEYAVVWEHARTTVEDMGIGVGKAARDPSRCWYEPARVPWGSYEARAVEGPDLDVDAVLTAARERGPRSRRPPQLALVHGGRGRPNEAERFRAWMAKADPAVDGEGGSDKMLTVACTMVRRVADRSSHVSLLTAYSDTCIPPWSDKEIAHKLESAYVKANYEGWPERPERMTGVGVSGLLPSDPGYEPEDPEPEARRVVLIEDHGQPAKIAENAVRMLAVYPGGAPRLDLLSRRVVWPDGRLLEDHHEVGIQGWLMAQPVASRVRIGIDAVHAAVVTCATANAFHPVRDYLERLAWDGTPRIEAFAATHLGAESPLAASYLRCFFVGAVARAMGPGCQLDTVLVLEGKQGARKTSALRALFGSWFGNATIDVRKAPDCYQALDGFWGYELAEVDQLKGAEAGRVKAYVSAREDTYRPSYGRNTVTRSRQVAFAATTNAETYLTDETGARRWHAVRCGDVDVDAVARDRDQLWAEATALYLAGAPWWLPRDLEAHAAEDIDERRQRDPWEALLASSLAGVDVTSTGDCFTRLGVEPGRQDNAMQQRLGWILRHQGWAHKKAKKSGVCVWIYVRGSSP